MTIQVIIVDEEFNFAENVASVLRIEGFDPLVLTDATEALQHLSREDVDWQNILLLIDVSLAPGEDIESFSAEITDEFMETGIVLTRRLKESGSIPKDGKKVILYTAHYTTELWGRITQFCEQERFRSWQKRANADPKEILELIYESIQ